MGCEPKPEKSINHHSKTEFLEDVENAVGEEVWNIVHASLLRVIIRFIENKFTWSSKIVEHLLFVGVRKHNCFELCAFC